MAVAAAPLVIPAAEALWGAMVFVGSALATAMGIVALSNAIDNEFSEAKSCAVQECPEKKRQECGALRADILSKYQKLGNELQKYDPAADAIGGFKMKWGVTKPCGHYIEISNLQRGLKNDLESFQKECGGSGVKIDRNVDRMANQTIERPPGC
jgi:hypothetical protein